MRDGAAPAVLLLAADFHATGGIERVTRELRQVLADEIGAVGVISVWETPSDGRRVPLRGRVSFAWRAIQAARRAKDPIVVCAHPHLAPVALACRLTGGSRYVVWCHGTEVWAGVRPLIRLALRKADGLVAVSRFTAERLAEEARVPLERVHIVPPAVAGWVAPTNARAPVPTVLTVSRLRRDHRYKGIDTLLYAWPLVLRQLPSARLVVVGDGDDRSRLERLAETLGLQDRVTFAGSVDDEELGAHYGSAWAFALPARFRLSPPEGEGFGIVFLEAALAGVPVVAGRGGGASEAVVDGETGVLVEPEDPIALADQLTELLRDEERATRLGQAGRVRVLRDFGPERFRAGVTQVMAAVAGDPRS